MRVRTRCLGLLASCLLGLQITQSAQAQATSRQNVEAAVAQAQALAKSGDWPQADELLSEQLAACSTGDAGLACRPLLAYTQAYLREQQARAEPERRRELLEAATRWYQRVLADVPGHTATVANLVGINRQLGEDQASIRLLEKAIATDANRRDEFAVLLGDLYRDQQDLESALHMYERAATWNPASAVPPERIVEIHRHLPAERLGALVERLPAWADAYPRAAERGLRLAIEAAVNAGDRRAAEDSLLQWASLLARQRWLTRRRVDALLQVWEDEPLRELRAYIEDVEHVPGWWRDDTERRQVITEVALALGHQDVDRNGPLAAKKRLARALQELAPESHEYYGQLEGFPLVRLELQTEFAALLDQYPDIEQGGEFQDLIWSIFESKGEAYASDDLVAIQRHHTVLGIIYARDSRRELGDHGAMNAVFQLHHAIRAANRLTERGGVYQPLPRLKQMLAEACEEPSPIAAQQAHRYCQKDAGSAIATLYLEAAKAYLDTDALERAASMLDKTVDTQPRNEERDVLRALGRVLSARTAIEQITSDEASAGAPAPWVEEADFRWVAGDDLVGVSDAFLKRQRFKALSDYATKIAPFARMHPATGAQLEHVMPLLDAAAKGLVLAGTVDELRVEALASLGVRYASRHECPGPDGEDLRWVQRALRKLIDPTLVVDGASGPHTEKALYAFQHEHGLSTDGVAGGETKSKLRELLCQSRTSIGV